eukprot:scaffold158764_cov15-Prasinocladus_malaysianus.AAC.1
MKPCIPAYSYGRRTVCNTHGGNVGADISPPYYRAYSYEYRTPRAITPYAIYTNASTSTESGAGRRPHFPVILGGLRRWPLR